MLNRIKVETTEPAPQAHPVPVVYYVDVWDDCVHITKVKNNCQTFEGAFPHGDVPGHFPQAVREAGR